MNKKKKRNKSVLPKEKPDNSGVSLEQWKKMNMEYYGDDSDNEYDYMDNDDEPQELDFNH